MTTASMRQWLGYDWFKLIVAIILILLLLTLSLTGTGTPAANVTPAATIAPAVAVAPAAPAATVAPAVAPAAPAAAAATAAPAAAPAAQVAMPILTSPASGTSAAPGPIIFSGTADPNAAIQVLVDGQPIGKTTADASGAWSLDATLDTPGDHAIVVQALDDKGAVAAAAAPVSIALAATAATAAPSAQIAAPTLNMPTGALTPGALALSGTGTPSSQLEIIVDGQSAGQASVGTDGTWALPVTLAAGEHAISARALDPAGAPAAESTPARVTVAAASPAAPPAAGGAPAISFPADGAQIPSGPFTMTGTGTPGSQIEVLDSDKLLGSAGVGADGTWSLPITPSGATAAYSSRPAGSTDVSATPIRVTIGTVAAATCDSLAVNCDAWVTRVGGRILRLRSSAGTSGQILFKLPVGTQMKLQEGPQPADGYTWWRVTTVGGRTGWVAGEELRTKPD